MLQFIFQQLSFYFAIVFILFLPGYFLLKTLQGKSKTFNSLEMPVFSFALSILLVDFLMLAANKLQIPLTRFSIMGLVLFFCLINFLLQKIHFFKKTTLPPTENITFSKKQLLILLSLILATIFIKTIYLSGAVLPSATDLGHHMYWSKAIAQQGSIPVYEKAEITPENTLEIEPIADFIVGEHLIFAAIGLLTGANFVSAFPVLILFLIHLATIAALFLFSLELFKDSAQRKNIAILTLFFTGPLYAISSPQMKFVSGGVIGNTIGNFLIPLTLYFLLKGLMQKNATWFGLAVFSGLGMAYTHHLSTFIFIFIILFSLLFFGLANLSRKTILTETKNWLRLLFNPKIILLLLFAATFVFFIYTPTYLNTKAIDTAVGTPSKATRVGLTLNQLAQTAGEARMAFAFLGIALLLFNIKRKNYTWAITLGWTISLAIMSLKPQWLLIDIPSNRIASYVVFPFGILSAFAFTEGFAKIKQGTNKGFLLKPLFFVSAFFLLIIFSLQSGQKENADFVDYSNNAQKIVQTYHASDYLANTSTSQDMALKDHNYLTADSWIKLSFMRGYNYPLSRGYFKRYEDETKKREMCTYHMITTPSSQTAQDCFVGTGTNFIMVNPNFDNIQFEKNRAFSQVYSADDVSIFYRN